MELDNVFELIRSEDAILWIGSGFSLYAGYPNGNQLANKIYENLTPSQKTEIGTNLQLMDLAEQFVRLKGGSRNALNSIVKAEFNKQPNSIKWHNLLTNIPHIKTIITTNYDRLFETAYKNDLHVILSPSDIAYRDNKVELFKAHGDVNHPDSMIITREDYTNFFQRRTGENLVWTAIKERLSCKSVIFIGYDLEDDNIKAILRDVAEALGTNRKEMFLIAPHFKQHKIQYLARNGIQYLNYKGEVFIDKLHKNIKENIASDFDKGKVSPDTLRNFFLKNNLSVGLASVGNQFKINSVGGLNGKPTGNLVMQFKKDKEFIDSFHAFATGERFGDVVLDASNLENAKLLLNGIKLFDDTKDYRIVLNSQPQHKGVCSVVFDDGSEFENINYQVFNSPVVAEVKADYKKSVYQFRWLKENNRDSSISLTFKYEQTGNFDSLNDAISVHRLLLNIAISAGFKIYFNGNSDGVSMKPLEDCTLDVKRIKNSISFFESLKLIEKYFKVRFTNIGNYSREDLDNLKKALLVVNGGSHIQSWDEELKFDLSQGASLDLLMNLGGGGTSFEIEHQNTDEIYIYGQKITLGYLLGEPLDLYITNLEDVQAQNTSIVILRSRTRKIRLSYRQTLKAVSGEKNLLTNNE